MRSRFLAAGALGVLAPLALVSTTGSASASVPLPTPVTVQDVLIQSDGKMVASLRTTATDRFTLVRLQLDGALDPTFGGDGIVETVIEPTRHSFVRDIALQPDGRIIAAGHVIKDVNDSKFVLVRYRTDGTLDPTFSNDGKAGTDFVTRNGWNPSIAVAPDGSIVAAGSDTQQLGILMARYRADGSPDPSFDVDGITFFDLPEASEQINDVALDQQGNAVVAGRIHVPFTVPDNLLARVRPDGQLDAGFGNAGLVVWDAMNGDESARSLAIQPDGRIVAAGGTAYESFASLSRFLPSGQPDTSFGVAGEVITHVGSSWYGQRPGADVALLRDGRIAVSGTSGIPKTDVRLAVHTADGAPDPAFDGDDGVVEVDLGGAGQWDAGGVMAVTRDGKLVVAGTHGNSLTSPGTLDVVAVPTIAPAADLAPTIDATPNPAPAGPVEFVVHVRNDGPVGATGVQLTFEASQAIEINRVSQGTCTSPLAHVTTCTLGAIPRDGEALVSVGTAVTGFEEGLFASATVTSSSIDPDPSNNRREAEVLISSEPTG